MSEERDDAAAAAPDGAAPQAGSRLDERLAAVEAELAESKDRLLRALAETENVRRRAERERADASKYGASALAKDLLNVADNLRRALESVPEAQAADERTRNLLQGVAATERELLAAFERNGIRRIEPAGERFDHNLHQAIFEVENTGQPPGTVVQVLQPGYVMHDRLLRPAMVGVAKSQQPPSDMPRIDEVV
jgi:molecular chaperone GrpE